MLTPVTGTSETLFLILLTHRRRNTVQANFCRTVLALRGDGEIKKKVLTSLTPLFQDTTMKCQRNRNINIGMLSIQKRRKKLGISSKEINKRATRLPTKQ